MRAPKLRLGIDLGGSKIQAVVIDSKGRVVGEAKHATKGEDGYRKVLKRIARTASDAMARANLGKEERRSLATLGLGVPGPVDPASGVVHVAHNLGWTRKTVAADLGELLGRRVVLGNDVTFGAFGEATYGAAAGASSACAAFVGTGLGGAVVSSGRPLNGAFGVAGEIGHLRAPFGDARCGCGNRGCLETTASKVGIRRLLKAEIAAGKRCAVEDIERLKASALRKAWKRGCPTTRRCVKRAAEALGWGLAALGTAVDPAVYVLGGGVVEALGRHLLADVRAGFREASPFWRSPPPVVRLARLGDHAVAIGAAVASVLDPEEVYR
jgi:glucokinase